MYGLSTIKKLNEEATNMENGAKIKKLRNLVRLSKRMMRDKSKEYRKAVTKELFTSMNIYKMSESNVLWALITIEENDVRKRF